MYYPDGTCKIGTWDLFSGKETWHFIVRCQQQAGGDKVLSPKPSKNNDKASNFKCF